MSELASYLLHTSDLQGIIRAEWNDLLVASGLVSFALIGVVYLTPLVGVAVRVRARRREGQERNPLSDSFV